MSKMKKLLVITISALLVMGLAAVIAVTAIGNPELTVSSPTIYYDGNRQITVTVSLPADSSYAIAGANFSIEYDPTVMTCNPSEITDSSWNATGINSASVNVINEHLHRLTFAWAKTTNMSYETTTDGTAWLVKVIFTVADNVPVGEYPITMSFPASGTYEGNMVNAAGQNVPTDLVNGKLTIQPIPISYNASITGLTDGKAVYGTTLGARATLITDTRSDITKSYTEAEIDHFTYQWYRGTEPIAGATSATYSPTETDISFSDYSTEVFHNGNTLWVKIGAAGNYTNDGVSAVSVKAVRAPYQGTVPAPVLVERSGNTITVGINDETLQLQCEFKKSTDTEWQNSPLFSGLDNSTYTFYARTKETYTHEASAASGASTGMKIQIPVSGTLAVSDTAPKCGDTLTAVTTGLDPDFQTHGLSQATYAWYRGAVVFENIVGTASSYTVGVDDIGQTITLIIIANDDFSDPLWGFTGTAYTTTDVVAKADNNATPVTASVASNDYVNGNGLMINVQADQEYKITQGGSTVSDWTSYTGTTKQFTANDTAWLKPATDYIIETRFASTATHNTGTEIASTPVTSGKWELIGSSLIVEPGLWMYGTKEKAVAGTSGIPAADSSMIFQWYRNDTPIPGANTREYTPVEADIGNDLKVTLTIGGSYYWAPYLNRSVHNQVSKASGVAAPAAPTVIETTYNTIKISTQAGYEYKLNDGSWSAKVAVSGDMTFTGLLPYTTYSIYARIAATATQYESASSAAAQATTLKQPIGGSVSINISGGGYAEWGKTLTANTSAVTPPEAVPYLIYNWYSGSDLVGSGTSYVTKESDFGKNVYLSLGVQSDCVYTVATAVQSNPVTILAKTISGTATINGLAADGAEWGTMLTADVTGIQPTGAQTGIAYSWSVGGTEKSAFSAFAPTSLNVGSTLTLTLTGTGIYRGSVTSANTVIVKKTIIEKPTVSGTPTFGSTISAAIDAIPPDAQTNIRYQWYRSDTETGTGTAITGAASKDYIVAPEDIGKWLSVAATVDSANAAYRGSTRSTAVEGGKEIITAAIGIAGTAKYGQELSITINSLTPASATYDVVWYRDGVQIKRGDVATAANKKYTLVQADIGTVISATIIGTGNYTGTPTAAQTTIVTKADGPAKPAAPTAVSDTYNTITVSGLAGHAYKLDSGSWGTTRTSDGLFYYMGMSPNTAYSVYCYIPETETHLASVSSDAATVTTPKQPIAGSVSLSGTLAYGYTLTTDIGSVLPAGAQAGLTYTWYRGNTAATTNELLFATTQTLNLGALDIGKYLKVVVTASGDYTGTLSVISTAAVAKGNVSAPGTPTLNAKTYNTVTINSVTANQYAITQTLGGGLDWIDGLAAITTFDSLSPNMTYYIYTRVKETETHNASDPCTTPLSVTTYKQPLGGTVTITGDEVYGGTLTAVITGITPANAQSQLNYKWYRVVAAVPEAINGATSQTYTIGASDVGLTLRVRVTAEANSDYISYIESSDTFTVAKKDISGSISITGSASFGDTLSVNIANVAPAAAQGTLTYQWQRYKKVVYDLPSREGIPNSWTDITGATSPTYTVTASDIGTYNGEPIMLRVIVCGDDVNYTNVLYSGSVTPGKKVIGGTISITGTSQYGSTVTASVSVVPSAADSEMSYRWFVNGTEITGRTASTFNINDSSWIGKTLTVEKYVSDPDSNYTGSIASAGVLIGKTANPAKTVPVTVLAYDKTSITIRVVHGQIYSIDGGLTWTDETFDGVFRGLTPGLNYTILTKIPGSETMDESVTLSFTQQTEPDAINVTYQFYNGIKGTVIGPSRVEIGTKVTIRVIAPDGYRLNEIFDSMPGGVVLTPIGNDTYTFIAGQKDVWLFIVFTSNASTGGTTTSSSITSSAVSSVSSTITSKPGSAASSAVQTSSQTSSGTGSDVDAPNMGENRTSANAAGITIALFAIFGIALIVIEKKKIKN